MLIGKRKIYSVPSNQGVNWYLEGSDVERIRYNQYRKYNREIAENACNNNIDLPAPLHVIIETSSMCNLKCGFCNREAGLSRKKQNMDLPMFKRIIDEAAQMRVHSTGLYALGEPFMNSELRQMINYAKGAGIPLCDVSTNGMFEMADVVLGTSLNELIVSLEANKKVHEKLRVGASWEKIMCNLETLWMKRKRLGYMWPIIRLQIIDLPENRDYIENFIDWGLNYADTVYVKRLETMRQSLGNRLIADDVAENKLLTRIPCKMLWFTLTVDSDGTIEYCCHSPHCKASLGNIKEISLKQAWEKLKPIRQAHKKGEYTEICQKCTDWNW